MKITPEKLATFIKSGNIAPLYIFVGENEYRKVEAIKFITKKLRELKKNNLTVMHFSVKEMPADQVVDKVLNAVNTFSLFQESRLIVVESLNLKNFKDKFVKTLNFFSEGNTVIFNIDAPDITDQKIVKNYTVVGFGGLDRDVLIKMLHRTLREQNIRMAPGVIDYFLDAVGGDIGRARSEIEKLSLIVYPSKEITKEHIDEHILGFREFSVYDLLDAMLQKKLKLSIVILEKLIEAGNEPMFILYSIIYSMREFLITKLFSQNDKKLKEVYSLFKRGSDSRLNYFIRINKNKVSRLSSKELVKAYQELAKIDVKFRRSKVPFDVLLMEYIYRFITGGFK